MGGLGTDIGTVDAANEAHAVLRCGRAAAVVLWSGCGIGEPTAGSVEDQKTRGGAPALAKKLPGAVITNICYANCLQLIGQGSRPLPPVRPTHSNPARLLATLARSPRRTGENIDDGRPMQAPIVASMSHFSPSCHEAVPVSDRRKYLWINVL